MLIGRLPFKPDPWVGRLQLTPQPWMRRQTQTPGPWLRRQLQTPERISREKLNFTSNGDDGTSWSAEDIATTSVGLEVAKSGSRC